MRFLKDNKKFVVIAVLMTAFAFVFDSPVILWLRDFHKANSNISSWLISIDRIVNFVGHGSTLLIGAFLFFMLGRYYYRKYYDAGKLLFINLITTGIVVQIIKHIVGRARPRITENFLVIGPSLKSGYDSFPSGHSAMVFCLAYTLSNHYPRWKGIFYLFAVIISFDRVKDLSHFPSDVLAGACVGIAVAALLTVKYYQSGKPGEQNA